MQKIINSQALIKLSTLIACCLVVVGFTEKCQAQRADSLKADSIRADSLKKKPPIELSTILIRGQRKVVEQRMDGIVFNAESLPSIAGSDASDVLRKVPMISVDGNGGLTVRGSSNVKVLIDGKPSEIYSSNVADALRAIRGENIVRIEVITNPSSRYDAEGTDAVVNIITRKAKNNGTNGNIGGVAGNRTETVMGDIHRKQGAFLFNGDTYYQKFWNRNGSVLQRNADNRAFFQKNETRQTGDYLYGGFNLLYSLDSLNTFSLGYRVRRSFTKTAAVSDNYNDNPVQALLFQRTMETPLASTGNTFNIGFTGLSKDKKIEYALLGMYTPYKTVNNYVLQQNGQNNTPYNENFFSTSRNNDYIIQADYAQSFTNHWKWETGGKLTRRNTQNESVFEVLDPGSGHFLPDDLRSTRFAYHTRLYAAYSNMSIKFKRLGMSGGVRYEKTRPEAIFRNQELAIPSFTNWVPQALIQLMVNAQTSIKLSYAMKLARPAISNLDPTVNTSDSLTLQYGNPDLDPERTNRYQLSYSVTGVKLFRDFTLFFNDNRNTIENIRLPLGDGRFQSTWRNAGSNQRLGLSATINWKPVPAFTLGAAMNGQFVWLESKALGIQTKGLMRQLTLNASYRLPRGYSVDFYGYFDAKNLRLQGYRAGWKFYNMTLNKKLKNERLNLSFRMETFLKPHTYIDEVIESPAFRQRQSYRYQNQNMRFTFSYKIGKKEIRNPRVRDIDQ